MLSYRMLIIASLVLSCIWMGCDDTNGGSYTSQPLADEPAILDAALAINVTEDRPDGIADNFFEDTERIYLWIYWINVPGTHTVEVRWFSPVQAIDEDPIVESTEMFTSSSGKAITTFFIDRPTGGFDIGEWFVEVYLDGFFERSYLFQVQ